MQIARVVGTVVSTQKHRKFEGAKLMLVQPVNIDDTPRGNALLAVDGVGAGVDEKVLVVLEGRNPRSALSEIPTVDDADDAGVDRRLDRIERKARLFAAHEEHFFADAGADRVDRHERASRGLALGRERLHHQQFDADEILVLPRHDDVANHLC